MWKMVPSYRKRTIVDLKSLFNFLYHWTTTLGDTKLPNFIDFFFLVLARCISCIILVYWVCLFAPFNKIQINY
jgi:hypothetical protein